MNRSSSSGVTLIELLIALAVLIITLASGVVVWRERVSPMPTPTPTPIISPTPTTEPFVIISPTPPVTPSPPIPVVCEPVQMPCLDVYVPLWYYDAERNECYQPHSKCGGSSFTTKEECERNCVELPSTQPPVTPISCQTDAGCPSIACAQGCPAKGPCPPCPQNKCIDGKCQKVYPNYSEFLDKKIQLYPSQTARIKETNLSLTLLRIRLSQKDCYTCPVDTEVEVRSDGRIEKITFRTPGIATKELGPHRVKEVFGFQIRLENVRPELIILSVQKL